MKQNKILPIYRLAKQLEKAILTCQALNSSFIKEKKGSEHHGGSPRLSLFSDPSVCKFAQVKTWNAQDQWLLVFSHLPMVF